MFRKRKKFYPPFKVNIWQERDRMSVVVYDSKDNVVVEWWDNEVLEMCEDGFFICSRGAEKFKQSVLDYCNVARLI